MVDMRAAVEMHLDGLLLLLVVVSGAASAR